MNEWQLLLDLFCAHLVFIYDNYDDCNYSLELTRQFFMSSLFFALNLSKSKAIL